MSPPDPSLLVLVIQVALVASVSAAMNSNRVVVIDTHNHIHVRVSLEPFLHLNTFQSILPSIVTQVSRLVSILRSAQTNV